MTTRRIDRTIKRDSLRPFYDMMRVIGPLLFMLAMGCDEKAIPESSIDVLRIGILPDESEDILIRKYTPLMANLESETGIPCRFVIPDSYESLLADFRARKIDLAYFGGLTFVAAEQLAGAVPLVMRLKDQQFTSYFIVRADDSAQSLTEYQGRSLSFGSRLSTSGHLMPRLILQKAGIEPEVHFSEVQYSGSHNATIESVRNGRIDIGAVNSAIFDEMIRFGNISYDEMRVLQQTPTYSNYVWAVQPNLPAPLCDILRESFLKLSAAQEEDSAVLDGLNAMGYLPASSQDFLGLVRIMSSTGLLDELR